MKNFNKGLNVPQIDLHIASGNDLEMQKKIDEILKQQIKDKQKGNVKGK